MNYLCRLLDFVIGYDAYSLELQVILGVIRLRSLEVML